MKTEFRTQNPPQEAGHQKPSTTVFIDYESLYISFMDRFRVAPILDPLIEDVKKHGRVLKIRVFGDFTKPEIDQERKRIRTVTTDIIDCGNESGRIKKDFTDFIMLDHIYQEVIQNPSVEQYVLFTGDGHFSSAATFLKTFMDKIVGVYGVSGTLSRLLQDCCSWSKIINVLDDDDEVYRRNLLRNFKVAEQRGLFPTFHTTVEHTARNYGGDETRYEWVLRDMIDAEEVIRTPISINGSEFMRLEVMWDKVEAEQPALSAAG